MKFHELAIGQQFELEGETYVKSAPLVANHAKTGKQRFMARYVAVSIAGEVAPVVAVQREKMLRAETVISAFDEFYGHCLQGIENLPPEKQAAGREALAQARKEFLDSLH